MKLAFIIHDNDKTLNDFPLGPAYLIAYLRRKGFPDEDIDVISMDILHHDDEALARTLKKEAYDVLLIGMIAGYWQYRQLKRIMAVIDRLETRPVVVFGGFMFSPEPAYFMNKFRPDFIVLGEAERSLFRLLEILGRGGDFGEVAGLAYWDGKRVIETPRERPLRDLDSLPLPAWDKFPVEAYVPKVRVPSAKAQRSMPVLTSRGCLYHCSFCYRMEPGYRIRSIDAVVDECCRLAKDYYVNAICFRDELMMSSPGRAISLAEGILKAGLKIQFDIDGRLNAVSPEVLRALKQAGCVYINYGVESLDQIVLDNMNKKQTVAEILYGVEETIKAGIHPGLNVIFGMKGDDRKTALKIVDFLNKYSTYAELRTLKPVTPYPGSPLFAEAVEKGLLLDVEDFYENKHVNSDLLTCNFTDMRDEEFYEVLYEANSLLLQNYYNKKKDEALVLHKKVYFEKFADFRGVRH